MQSSRLWTTLAAALCIAGPSAIAQVGSGGTITDGDAVFRQSDSPTSATGVGAAAADMRVAGATGADHVFQNWWWYRVEGVDTREFCFANASAWSWSGNVGTVDFTTPSFTARLTYTIVDTGANAARLDVSCTLNNTTQSSINVALFNYHDFDIQPNLGDDRAELAGANSIRVSDVGAQMTGRYTGTGAAALQVGAFAGVRTILADTVVNNLSGAGLPFGPGDFTGAFQWNLMLSPGTPLTITAEVSLEPPAPRGACCVGQACSSQTQADCTGMNGTYQGDNSSCAEDSYSVASCGDAFEDISATGTAGPSCDDCGLTAPIGFTFPFFGASFSSIGISSNGYLTFGATLGDLSNDPIPNVAVPNDLIAGFWDDLNPLAGGNVRYQTLGSSPNQRFIVQWTNVPHFNAPTLLHTFQIVLRENGNVQYRYLLLPALSATVTPSIGVENSTGMTGTAIDPATVTTPSCHQFTRIPAQGCPQNNVPGDMNCDGVANLLDCDAFRLAVLDPAAYAVQFPGCPILNGDFNGSGQVTRCDRAAFCALIGGGRTCYCCPADFNMSGAVSSQDLFDFLAAFFTPGSLAADFNCSGAVSSQDLFDFLAAFFTPCP